MMSMRFICRLYGAEKQHKHYHLSRHGSRSLHTALLACSYLPRLCAHCVSLSLTLSLSTSATRVHSKELEGQPRSGRGAAEEQPRGSRGAASAPRSACRWRVNIRRVGLSVWSGACTKCKRSVCTCVRTPSIVWPWSLWVRSWAEAGCSLHGAFYR